MFFTEFNEKSKQSDMACYFKLNTSLIAIMYMCYKYRFPLSMMIAFYESYAEMSLYVFKAMACKEQVELTDEQFQTIVEESRKLYWQTVDGEVKESEFSVEFQKFITKYFMECIEDVYAEKVKLRTSTKQLYDGDFA